MKELNEVTLPEYEVYHDTKSDRIFIKFRDIRREMEFGRWTYRKRGCCLVLTGDVLNMLMQDIAEGEEYPMTRVEPV
jgi:hypothetical protein